ncbi:hypothetical protein ACLB2K_017562 [Fragaria x ananassa]
MVAISELNDDLLGHILKRVSDPGDRKRVSEVCKLWLTVEGLTRRSLTLLRLSRLRQVLPRFPNLVSFQTSGPYFEEADLVFVAQTCPKLETIDLSTAQHGAGLLPENSLYGLLRGGVLPKLSKVSVRGRWRVAAARWVHRLYNLTYLDLGGCSDVDDYALEAIGLVCICLIYLNLELCGVSDNGLGFLAQGRCSKTLNTLVLADCKGITDLGLSHLQNFRFLEELDLKGCNVTDTGVIAGISPDRSLKKLNLANLGKFRHLSDQSMAFVAANCPNLEILDLSSSHVTGAGVRAFYGHRCLQSLVLRWCPEFSWSDIEHMVLGCKSLKSMLVSMPPMHSVPESVSRIVSLIDEG